VTINAPAISSYTRGMATAVTGASNSDLIIDAPGSESIRVRLEHGRYRLGRSSANELAFPADQELSREHLVFERTGEGWTIRDLGSRNGTQLNGVRVAKTLNLTHGDRITVGHLSIRYDMRGEFADAKVNEITFVDQELPGSAPAVSLDLKAALQVSADLALRPSWEGMHLGALVRAARELAGHDDLDKLFELLLDLSLGAVKASRAVVMTLEGNGDLKCRAIRGEGLLISTAVRDLVMNEKRSLLVCDAQLDRDLGPRPSIERPGIRSILAVPIQTDEQVIGLLYLDSLHLVHEFSPEDLSLVTVMANIAGIRIQHARWMEQEEARKILARDLERGAEIQRRLLPSHPPEVAGFDLAGYNAPCRTVGGDYYDFLPYADGRVAILIGDVSGKGLGAALLMSSLQARAHILFGDPEPFAAQFRRLNGSIAANCPDNCFITLFAGVLDPASGELIYCNAGHNPPLLLHSNDEVEALGATGVPLGIARNANYDQKSCVIRESDVLVLFSDGVTEACALGEDQEFGEERLLTILRNTRKGPAAAAIEAINAELLLFAEGAPAADDVTLVLVRRC
jgi:sigma-B regulation protein RsbU (phosphoserine phosphatase)